MQPDNMNMTDEEFDVLDELYFVCPYADLKNNTGFEDEELKDVLKELVNKGWVKLLKNADEEVPFVEKDFDAHFKGYFFLATKAGLLAHNGR